MEENLSMRDQANFYDEKFKQMMKIAKFLTMNLNDQKEKELAKKWLLRVSNIKSPVLEVKRDRNAFLSNLLKVLNDGVAKRCPGSKLGGICDPEDSLIFSNLTSDSSEETVKKTCKINKEMKFHSQWSKDYRTYVAVKPIEGRGNLVYMASSKKPGRENWDFPLESKYNNVGQ